MYWMKKKWMTGILMLMIPIVSYSQETKEIGVKDYDEIRIFGKMSVVMVPGTENKLYMESADVDLNEIDTEVEEKELKIKMTDKLLKKKRPDVFIRVTFNDLKGITALADAEVEFEKPVVQDAFRIKATSGSRIELSMDAQELDLKAYQGGTVVVDGKTQALDARVNTGGILTGTDLVCQKVNIKLNTGGKGELTVEKELEARVNTGSDFSYFGTPEKKDVRTVLGGSVSAWDEE
ncbi:MAG: head GIN domain-containing protein [Bacteroidales bacterium]